MRPGDVLLVHSTDFQSRLIQWGTHSFWGHCALAVSAFAMVEATGSGVVASPITKYDGHPPGHTRWIDTGLSDAGRDAAAKYALARVGRKYGRMEIASLALGIVTGWHFYFGMDGTDICSGLVGEALERADVTFPKEGTNLTPADISAFYAVVPRLAR
jgi:uncharacterized protein YycO